MCSPAAHPGSLGLLHANLRAKSQVNEHVRCSHDQHFMLTICVWSQISKRAAEVKDIWRQGIPQAFQQLSPPNAPELMGTPSALCQ